MYQVTVLQKNSGPGPRTSGIYEPGNLRNVTLWAVLHDHTHKILVGNLDKTIQISVPGLKGVRQRFQHNTCLDELIEFKSAPGF